MFIRIENASGLPITRQVIDQITSHIAGATLRPGDRLPSVRQLARQLAVNQNTILRVYERLTEQGLLERIHGSGTFVATGAARKTRSPVNLMKQDIERLADKAVQLGVRKADLQNRISQAYTRAKQKHTAAKKRGA